MQIRVKIPRNSPIRQIIRDTYTDLYRKFKATNPKDKNYTRAKLIQNIRQAASINGKVLLENDIVNSSFDTWTAANYKQVYHFHWYFAVTLRKDNDGNVIAVVQDAHYEGEHYNGPRLLPPYSDTNESIKSTKIRLTENQLRSIIKESVTRILKESQYKPVAYNKTIKLDNGVKVESLVTLSDGAGKYDIYEDDGCYVVWNRKYKGENNHWYIFPELLSVLKKLPNLPIR